MGASPADPCGLDPLIVFEFESSVVCILYFIWVYFDVLLSPLSKGCHKSLSLQGNKRYREICQRSTASTLRSTVATIDRYSSAVDRRDSRPMLLSGRPSPTEDEWRSNVWGFEAVRNAKGDRGKASKRQERSWHPFPFLSLGVPRRPFPFFILHYKRMYLSSKK